MIKIIQGPAQKSSYVIFTYVKRRLQDQHVGNMINETNMCCKMLILLKETFSNKKKNDVQVKAVF